MKKQGHRKMKYTTEYIQYCIYTYIDIYIISTKSYPSIRGKIASFAVHLSAAMRIQRIVLRTKLPTRPSLPSVKTIDISWYNGCDTQSGPAW